ncbi:MAG: hypothetical protein LLF94_11610 [Chlamydiales bacterium]|nr:hypothetical protein [Chlamydiales bacterium]
MKFLPSNLICLMAAGLAMTQGNNDLAAAKHHSSSRDASHGQVKRTKKQLKECCEQTQMGICELGKEIHGVKHQLNEVLDELKEIEEGQSHHSHCGEAHRITQHRVTNGFVITEPGLYNFCEDISFSASSEDTVVMQEAAGLPNYLSDQLKTALAKHSHSKQGHVNFSDVSKVVQSAMTAKAFGSSALSLPAAAITIDASNVYIDMKNFTLSQEDGTSNVVGFYIVPGNENITIVNGTITLFKGAAIEANIADSVPQSSINDLTFKNLIITNNGIDTEFRPTYDASGINLTAPESGNYQLMTLPESFKYTNVTIEDCKVDLNASGGIKAWLVDGLKIQNTTANNTYMANSQLNLISGLFVGGSKNVQITDSMFNDSSMDSGMGLAVAGALMVANQNVYINGCQFNDAYSDNALFIGGLVGGSAVDMFIENSQFNHPSGNGGLVAGLHMGADSNATFAGGPLKFDNCQFDRAYHGVGNTFSFGGAAGVNLVAVRDVVITNCQANDTSSDEPTLDTAGFAIGAYFSDPITADLSSARNILIQNTVASDIKGAGHTYGYHLYSKTDGVRPGVPDSTNFTLDTIIAERIIGKHNFGVFAGLDRCESDAKMMNVVIKNSVVTDVRENGVGIEFRAVDSPFLFNNIVQRCNTGIWFIGNDKVETTNGTVQENKVSNCKVGYRDNSKRTTTAWIKNLSNNNNRGFWMRFKSCPPIQTGYKGYNAWYNIELCDGTCQCHRYHRPIDSSSSSSSVSASHHKTPLKKS